MIKILHLFPKLLNLYGDRGNIIVMVKALEKLGADVLVTETEEPEVFDPSDFDFVFCGAGTENKIAVAAKKLSPLSAKYAVAADSGVIMLFTGSAMELTCKEIITSEGNISALGIFNASVRRTSDRQTGDVLYKSNISDKYIAGFINKSGFVRSAEDPMFTPWFGPSSFEDEHQLDIAGEGLSKNGVMATYVTGPILVRNPWFKRIIAEGLFEKCCGAVPCGFEDEYADKGWAVTVSELEKRKNLGA